jgi:septum formation protein
MKKIILGSASPRRKELLYSLGFKFDVRVKETDETCPREIAPIDRALYIAWKKASVLRPELESNELLVCADTVVISGEKVLNKPANQFEAQEMLRSLSGKTHTVATGLVVCTKDRFLEKTVLTKVEFMEIPYSAIDYYIDRYKPFDKAGAYGIQEWIGHAFVKRIDGSYNNVVGLPTSELYEMINSLQE